MRIAPATAARVATVAAWALAASWAHGGPVEPQQAAEPAMPAGALRVYAVGDIADCGAGAAADSVAASTARRVPEGATVLALGDIAYPRADAGTLERCYEPTWGRHRARTLPVAGNHDYVDGGTRDLRAYFGLDGLAASDRYVAYARRLSDDWLLLALDSNVAGEDMRLQREWLARTLGRELAAGAANDPGPSKRAPVCVAVMWHTPVFSSGLHRGSGDHMRGLWQDIDAHRADVLLSGHEHFYEAFGPIDGSFRKQPDGGGVRQFVVGTGGARLYGFWRPPYASRARVLEHGVLELTLAPGRYTWRFIDTRGRVLDAGDAVCRRARGDTGSR